MSEQMLPKTGVGVMVMKGDLVLFGKRKGSHGEGEWATPGGHLEHLESFEDCARREVKEEAGLEIQNIRFLFLANLNLYAPKHYTHIGLVADWKSGEPKVLEPEKCEGWDWFSIKNPAPSPTFTACLLSYNSYLTGQNYYDIKDVEDFLNLIK